MMTAKTGTLVLNTQVDAPNFCFEVIHKESGRTRFFQSDWDYPGVALDFGWDMADVQTPENMMEGTPCDHSGTDGTIPCPSCGVMPCTFMEAALDFIQDHDGAEAEDPGYFNNDEEAQS